ncbi:hypothetical protein TNCV_3703331 [Trichonephila clavipes]|nr:hypothetical protein TNCV_3703331 [Trichonephila clavipes]
MCDPSSFVNPIPLAHADASRDVLPREGTSQGDQQRQDQEIKGTSTRGLLATDHVILNHGQVTWMTPELALHSPNYHTTPTGGSFSSRQIERASLLYTVGLWW